MFIKHIVQFDYKKKKNPKNAIILITKQARRNIIYKSKR